MEHSSGHGDEAYPPAPVPAHERAWRHPSEVGAEAWRRSEPPLSIGRGLLVVTTTCCLTLGAALTWATLDTHPGGLSAAAIRAETFVMGEQGSVSTEPDAVSPPTYRLEDGTVRQEPAIAVPLADGQLILTTAAAVRGARTLELRDAAGRSEPAHVVLVDDETGLAILVTDASSLPMAYEVATALDAGDELRFDDDTVVVVHDETISARRWYGLDQHEGSPVVNQRGELVGLCSQEENGMRVVLLERVDEILRQLGEG
ncbi:MAG: hypothetical protein ACO3AV_05995 [Ilumatobacteraceae bacterium]